MSNSEYGWGEGFFVVVFFKPFKLCLGLICKFGCNRRIYTQTRREKNPIKNTYSNKKISLHHLMIP